MPVTIDLFRNETETANFDEGEVIFREGDPGDAMYVVVEGSVKLEIRGQLLDTVGPGGVLGEMALVEKAPRVATATALTAIRLAAIPEKRFLFMVQQTPHFALQILRVVVERLRRMDERL
ncbi:MAG: cyclic nucleotide-binding domain-containing protein [Betaproteobacteria bacterium]|nr:cyclic nucleotide-binding domain-containing protein [Betaproteobacteria bacterium]